MRIESKSVLNKMRPEEKNYLMVNLISGKNNEDKNDCVMFIVDTSFSMKNFIRVKHRKRSKINHAVALINEFMLQLMPEDMIGIIEMKESPECIYKLSKINDKTQKKVENSLTKISLSGLSDIRNPLEVSKKYLDKVDGEKYFKRVIVITDCNLYEKPHKENLERLGEMFSRNETSISVINLNEYLTTEDCLILPSITNGNYYSALRNTNFRIVSTELENLVGINAKKTEVTISCPDIEFDLNTSGYSQRFNKNGSVTLMIGDMGIKREIIIGYKLKRIVSETKIRIKTVYKSNGEKIKENAEHIISISNDAELREEDDRIICKILNTERAITMNHFWDMFDKCKYDWCINELMKYKDRLKEYSSFVSAHDYISDFTLEANHFIKECKRKIRFEKDSALCAIS